MTLKTLTLTGLQHLWAAKEEKNIKASIWSYLQSISLYVGAFFQTYTGNLTDQVELFGVVYFFSCFRHWYVVSSP